MQFKQPPVHNRLKVQITENTNLRNTSNAFFLFFFQCCFSVWQTYIHDSQVGETLPPPMRVLC